MIFWYNLKDLTIMLLVSAGPLGRIRYLIPDLPKLPIIHQSVSSKDLYPIVLVHESFCAQHL